MIHRSENELALRMTEKRRRGCLGCLTPVIGALLFGFVVVQLVTAVIAPWGFYLGGEFHIIPYWQGWGTLHASSGNYPVYVRFWPALRSRSHMYPTSHLRGIGYLCTPRGERFRMYLTGDMRFHLPVHTDGEAISLGMDYWPLLMGRFMTYHRPSIGLVGHWKNPNLVMDDHGSIHRAFSPDGKVYDKIPANLPWQGEVVPVTLNPGSQAEFDAACKTR